MQGLLDAPRQGFTVADVMNVLQNAEQVTIDAGLELLDANDNKVQDISTSLVPAGSTVNRNNYATIHGGCTLNLETSLAWGSVRVKPYMLMSSPRVPAGPVRFNLGVFILTIPGGNLDDTPGNQLFTATGFDKLYLLQNPIGDSYQVAAGTNYFTAIKNAISAAGGGSNVALDNTKASATLPSVMVWPMDSSHQYTYLDVINDLLKAISYRGLWCDPNGAYRSEPYVIPANRAIEYTFTGSVTDPASAAWFQQNVAPGQSYTQDLTNVPNWWRFIQNNLAYQPVEGGGFYTVQNQNGGPTSQNAIGRTIKKVQYLNASGQADLQAQGDAIVAADQNRPQVFTFKSTPTPIAGHFDVATYANPNMPGAATRKVQAQQWTLPLDGSDMDWTFETVAAA